jgi:hypothetical protein
VKKNEAREELNQVIKEEVMLRCAAGELLQRVSATHRQCEADLRKLLVHKKMKSLADLSDINSPLRSDNLPPAVVLVDIERVAALSQSEMSPERRSRLRQDHRERGLCWQAIIRGWGDSFAHPGLSLPTSPKNQLETTPRLRRKSMQNLLFSVQLQQLSSSLDGEDLSIRASLSPGAAPHLNDHDDDMAITRQSVMEYMEQRQGSFFKGHQKKVYASQEGDRIRKLVKIEIENQLSRADCAESPHEKVLAPVLHALNGFVCGRLSGQERAAVGAYATGALGDQVRIMRSLLSIFLSFVRDREGSPIDSPSVRTQVSTDISDTSGLVDYLHSLSYADAPASDSRTILSSHQVLEFLHWAANIGDIIGLQVPLFCSALLNIPPQAIRFMTELIHRCLSKRMAQRSLEQTENLPVRSFGDNVLNEFKREVIHGIYSRRR